MSRVIFRLTLFMILSLAALLLSACGASEHEGGSNGAEDGDANKSAIRIPDSDTFGRDVVSFDSITYKRPDADALCRSITDAAELIAKNDLPYAEQLESVRALEGDYTEFLTMYTYVNIRNYRDTADEVFSAEFDHMSDKYPEVMAAVEELMRAAASSPHGERFESEYFGEGLIEKYSDAESFSETAVELLKKEAELEATYLAMQNGSTSVIKSIYLELVRTRIRIAEELGYESYLEYAYEKHGYDYEEADILDLTSEISKYATPVYQELSKKLFTNYFRKNSAAHLGIADTVNTLAEVYADFGKTYSDVYAYMLCFGLFDVETKSGTRFDGAFTTYLDGYESPFLFVTATERVTDTVKLGHEFGHFIDFFANGTSSASLDLSEVYSKSLEAITVLRLKDHLSAKDHQYLFYYQMESMLKTLILQGYYARFEHLVYSLDYVDVTEARVNALARQAALEMSLTSPSYVGMSAVMVPHLFIEPFYVESYCVSTAVALQFFFAEYNERGEGVGLFERLLQREEGATLSECLDMLGMKSPFKKGLLREVMNNVHYIILGSPYYSDNSNNTVYAPPKIYDWYAPVAA